jgi:hypothetical protein
VRIELTTYPLAEIEFGILLDEVATGRRHPRATTILAEAQKYPIREITKHTAHEYAELRKNVAATYLDSFVRSNRPRWIEQWVDRVTGEVLQIDENDLWIPVHAICNSCAKLVIASAKCATPSTSSTKKFASWFAKIGTRYPLFSK